MKTYSVIINNKDCCYCNSCAEDVTPNATKCPECGAKFIDPASVIKKLPVKEGDEIYFFGFENPVIVTGFFISSQGIYVCWNSDTPLDETYEETEGVFPIESINVTAFLDEDDVPEFQYIVSAQKIKIETDMQKLSTNADLTKAFKENSVKSMEIGKEEFFYEYSEAIDYYKSILSAVSSEYNGYNTCESGTLKHHYTVELVKLEEVEKEYPSEESCHTVATELESYFKPVKQINLNSI